VQVKCKDFSEYRPKPTQLSQRVCPVDLRRVELNEITRQPDSTLLNARKSPEQAEQISHSHHEGIAGTEQGQTEPRALFASSVTA